MKNPQHIFITGASSGLGAALALAYAAPSRFLSLHGRNAERLNQIADQARRLGTTVTVHIGDVTDAVSMRKCLEEFFVQQPVDLLIANAGISAGTGSGGETPEQSAAVFGTNLIGVLNTVNPVIEQMVQRGQGQIALMSSLAGFVSLPGAPSYSSSKAAVRVYGEALRVDLAPKGISVNVICPGFVTTPMTARNSYPMPFIMSAEKAAGIIQKGLTSNRAIIAFPWPMALGIRLFGMMPLGFRECALSYAPRKPSLTDT
jgi:short-subunit dehydrogenase